jgi:hypothetical protein
VACSFAQCLLERTDGRLYLAFDDFVKRHYSRYALEHIARIDVWTRRYLSDWTQYRLDMVFALSGGLSTACCVVDVAFLCFSPKSACSSVAILREQGIGSFLGLLTCLCHLVVCVLSRIELANSSLEGLGQYPATSTWGSASHARILDSARGYDSKPRLCEDGRSQATRLR